MDGPKEETKFIPFTEDHGEGGYSNQVYKKGHNFKIPKLGLFVAAGFLVAWMTWITITTQVPEKKGEHEMFELLQTGNTSLALFEEDREKRNVWNSLVNFATIANKYLTWVRRACDIGLLVHQAVAADLWGMCQALSAVCIYSTMQREIEEDQAAIQRIKTEEVELKRRIKITELKMTRAFEVMK